MGRSKSAESRRSCSPLQLGRAAAGVVAASARASSGRKRRNGRTASSKPSSDACKMKYVSNTSTLLGVILVFAPTSSANAAFVHDLSVLNCVIPHDHYKFPRKGREATSESQHSRGKNTSFRKGVVCEDVTGDESASNRPSQTADQNTARGIMHMIKSRYDMPLDDAQRENNTRTASAWARTQNYIYRGKRDHLSLSQVEEVLAFLEKVFENKKVIASLLQTTPRVLRKNVKTQLRPTVDFLRGLYGDDLFHEAIDRNPDLIVTSGLGYDSMRNQGEDVEAYFSENLSMSKSSLHNLKQSSPSLFQLSLSRKIEPAILFLKSVFDNADFSALEGHRLVVKTIKSAPHLLGQSVETNLRPTLDFLREKLDFDRFDLAKVIKTCPGILGLSVKHNLSPTIDFMATVLSGHSIENVEEIGSIETVKETQKQELRKCISKHPQLLCLSIDNLRTKVAFFDEIDRVSFVTHDHMSQPFRSSTTPLAAKVALSSPSVYSLSLPENIMPKVAFLAETWGLGDGLVESLTQTDSDRVRYDNGLFVSSDSSDTHRSSLSHRLGEYPSILTLSLEGNIQPTVQFYKSAGYLTSKAVDKTSWQNGEDTEPRHKSILRARYIATSLYNTLLPRWDYLRQVGKSNDSGTFEIPPLHLLAAATDSKYCAEMCLDLNAYVVYKKEAIPRLKFSSQFETWVKTGRPIDGV